jgi:23S rRNA (uridine2552-2'-O)-methyltransferase
MSKAKSKSSKQWLQRQHNDDYVKRAALDGYRSRSAYKLLEINKKDKIFRRGMTVVDLGAAPGGWSQVAIELVKPGRVIALDILSIDLLEGVDIILGDFREAEVHAKLLDKLAGAKVDLVISDMAPNFSGISGVDVPRAVYLAEIALDFAEEVLVPGGCFLVKLFQGEGFTEYVQQLKQTFDKVVVRKPKASRAESRETYLLGSGLRANRVRKKEVSLE